jgi:hypothetical protein
VRRLETVDGIKRVQERRWHRDGSKDAFATFLEAFNDDDSVVDVDAIRSQRQRFGDPAAGVRQGAAEGSYALHGRFGNPNEVATLRRSEVLAVTVAIVELHYVHPGGFASYIKVGVRLSKAVDRVQNRRRCRA